MSFHQNSDVPGPCHGDEPRSLRESGSDPGGSLGGVPASWRPPRKSSQPKLASWDVPPDT
jgi:hypothetical protein